MSQILFEQYKEALRRGHIAAARGHLEAAVTAYETAAAIAPNRALPWISLGDVLHRLGRHETSDRAYGNALQRAPGDEAALRGRAAVRLAAGRPVDAARDFEALAESLERSGRLAEASDAACTALEIAESRTLRRTVERLARLLAGLGDDAAIAALARAARHVEPAPIPREEAPVDDALEPSEAAGAVTFAFGPARIEAEALLAAGDTSAARTLLLSIAAAEREAGRLDAALDACLILMTIDPADLAVQLEIAANQATRGWTALAAQKVRLLRRLADLDSNAEAIAAIHAFARDHAIEVGAGSAGSGSAAPA